MAGTNQEQRDDRRAGILKRISKLRARANCRDQDAIVRLRRRLARNQWLVRELGDMTKYAESAVIGPLAGGDALVREAVFQQLQGNKADLVGPHATALERLLVDQIAINHLVAQHAQQVETTTTGGSPQQEALRIKRAESAQRRLLQAARTLATLRAHAPAGLLPSTPPRVYQSGKPSA